MRHYLTQQERSAFGAPDYVDDLGSALLTIVSAVGRDVPLVIVGAFIDETGTDNQPRMMVGGLMSSALKWLGFTHEWNSLLAQAEVPYAHQMDMERNKKAFVRENWWKEKRRISTSRKWLF